MADSYYRAENLSDVQRLPTPDNFTYLIFVDHVLHIPEKPFCYDAACECHEDDVLIFQIWLYVLGGLMTPDEATDFVKGKGI